MKAVTPLFEIPNGDKLRGRETAIVSAVTGELFVLRRVLAPCSLCFSFGGRHWKVVTSDPRNETGMADLTGGPPHPWRGTAREAGAFLRMWFKVRFSKLPTRGSPHAHKVARVGRKQIRNITG